MLILVIILILLFHKKNNNSHAQIMTSISSPRERGDEKEEEEEEEPLPSYGLMMILFVLIGFITDFTETAEYQWYQRFSIADTTYLYFIQHFAWGPVSILIASLSDRLSHEYGMKRMNQCVLALIVPIICWVIISSTCTNASSYVIIISLFLAEFAPAILLTVLNAVIILYNRKHHVQLVPSSQRYRLIGKTIANWSGGKLLSLTDLNVVFSVQTIVLLFTLLLLMTCKVRRGRKIVPTEEEEEEEGDKEKEKEEEEEQKEEKREIISINRYFIFFVTVCASIPGSESSFFYFIFGPLEFTAADIGLIESLSTILAILCTFAHQYIQDMNMKTYGIVVSLGLFTQFFLKFCLVTRLTRYSIWIQFTDFKTVLLISLVTELADSILFTNYCISSSKHSSVGKEAAYYAILMSIPKLGRVIHTLIDFLLTIYLGIDHHTFNQLPIFFLICSYYTLLCVVVVFRLKTSTTSSSVSS